MIICTEDMSVSAVFLLRTDRKTEWENQPTLQDLPVTSYEHRRCSQPRQRANRFLLLLDQKKHKKNMFFLMSLESSSLLRIFLPRRYMTTRRSFKAVWVKTPQFTSAILLIVSACFFSPSQQHVRPKLFIRKCTKSSGIKDFYLTKGRMEILYGLHFCKWKLDNETKRQREKLTYIVYGIYNEDLRFVSTTGETPDEVPVWLRDARREYWLPGWCSETLRETPNCLAGAERHRRDSRLPGWGSETLRENPDCLAGAQRHRRESDCLAGNQRH
jgi:hypothetical protein